MIKDDGTVIHFNNPKVQASLNANTFAVSGHADNKQITEMLPGILNHLGAEGFNQLKRLASSVNACKYFWFCFSRGNVFIKWMNVVIRNLNGLLS